MGADSPGTVIGGGGGEHGGFSGARESPVSFDPGIPLATPRKALREAQRAMRGGLGVGSAISKATRFMPTESRFHCTPLISSARIGLLRGSKLTHPGEHAGR